MTIKPHITGRPGSYQCEDPERNVGYGRTPREAFGDMMEERRRADTLKWETEALRRETMLRRIFGPFLMSR